MKQYTFSNSQIDRASDQLAGFLAEYGVERREGLRIRLAFEEVLLEYQNRFGENAVFTLKCKKRFSALRVELAVPGECFDPLTTKEADSALVNGILAGIGLAPSWSYKNGKNYLVFTPKKKPVSQTVKVLAAIVLALVVGWSLSLLPADVRSGVSGMVLTPVSDLFMGLITAVSVPLVFFSVLGSICSMGNMETLGKIGKRTLLTIVGVVALSDLIMSAIATLFYPVSAGGGGGADFTRVMEMIYDIFPNNLFEPFLTGNALQIIFVAVLVGTAMLILSTRINGVFTMVEELDTLVQTMMGLISGVLPIAVFAIFANMFASGNLNILLGSWKMILIMTALILLNGMGMVLWVALRKRVSPRLLIRKLLPGFMIAFTTASSSAALSTNVTNAGKKLGVHPRLASFGTPLGQILFKPATYIFLFVLELSMAESCGLEITAAWLVMAFITNLLLIFAIPPVAGGALMSMTVAFAQLGIPVEMMGVAVAINAIMDFLDTAFNTTCWQLTMINLADSMDMLDKQTLRSDC